MWKDSRSFLTQLSIMPADKFIHFVSKSIHLIVSRVVCYVSIHWQQRTISFVFHVAFYIVSRQVDPFCIQVYPSHSITCRMLRPNPVIRTQYFICCWCSKGTLSIIWLSLHYFVLLIELESLMRIEAYLSLYSLKNLLFHFSENKFTVQLFRKLIFDEVSIIVA